MTAYLQTRVRLRAAQRWSDAALDRLIYATAEEVGGQLTEGGLARFAGMVPGDDQRSLEQGIIAQLLEETRILLRAQLGTKIPSQAWFQPNSARDFLLYWTERFEVSNLKTLLRGKMAGERPAALLPRLTPMGTFARLDVDALAHVEDVSELLQQLERGHYAQIVRQARQAFEDSHDPFLLDAVLDRSYYEGLQARAMACSPALSAFISDMIERTNLIWLLRFRFNYSLPPAQSYYLLVAPPVALGARPNPTKKLWQTLAALPDLSAVLAALPAPWKRLLAGASDLQSVLERVDAEAERAEQRALGFIRPLMPDVRAFAYLLSKERTLRRVRAVLRGRHLGLPSATIQHVVRQH